MLSSNPASPPKAIKRCLTNIIQSNNRYQWISKYNISIYIYRLASCLNFFLVQLVIEKKIPGIQKPTESDILLLIEGKNPRYRSMVPLTTLNAINCQTKLSNRKLLIVIAFTLFSFILMHPQFSFTKLFNRLPPPKTLRRLLGPPT